MKGLQPPVCRFASVVSCSAAQSEEERDGEDMNAAQVTRQGARGAAKTQIRARIRDISFELTDIITGATWQAITPTLHVGRWNDIWEVRVNPFHLSKALAHVTLVVDTDRLDDEGGRALIALGIRGAVEACGRASEMVERLDGAYIHDGDWDEEQFILEP